MFSLLLLFAALSLGASPQPVTLPGLPETPSFNSYAGYVQVDAASDRNLFYFFAEAQNGNADAPVVLWQTGGPGCSSLIAMLSEMGPYRVNASDTSKLTLDAYSWNQQAHMLWVESPAGVGFSYSKNPSDYINVNDTRTANDMYNFLQTFVNDLFPQYQKNNWFITAESYGGHYAPTMSRRIIEGNDRMEGTHINLKGMAEGNAWTYMPMDNLGAIETWVQRAIASQSQVDAIKQHCNLSYVGPLRLARRDDACNEAINAAMVNFQYVDIYDIYVDVCETNPKLAQLKQMAKVSWFHGIMLEAINARRHAVKRSTVAPQPPFDRCADNHLTTYLNRLDVQKAINAVPADATEPIAWSECSSVVQYDFNSVAASVIPDLEFLFDRPDFHALVYSGDVDAIVPYWGTKTWIESINRTVKEPWRVWLDENNQAGGFVTVYDGFTFCTVRGAGHQAPEYQPARSFQMINQWITDHYIK